MLSEAAVITCSEKTDDSDDDEVELRRVSGPRFGTAGGHLDRDVVIACTPSCIAQMNMQQHSLIGSHSI